MKQDRHHISPTHGCCFQRRCKRSHVVIAVVVVVAVAVVAAIVVAPYFLHHPFIQHEPFLFPFGQCIQKTQFFVFRICQQRFCAVVGLKDNVLVFMGTMSQQFIRMLQQRQQRRSG